MSEPVDLDHLGELEQGTTEKPWCRWDDQEGIEDWDGFAVIGDFGTFDERHDDSNPVARVYFGADADYMVAAVNALPALIAEVRQLRGEIEWYEDVDFKDAYTKQERRIETLEAALQRIANEDYRGNRPQSVDIAAQALREDTDQ